jgi:hypothetical protein
VKNDKTLVHVKRYHKWSRRLQRIRRRTTASSSREPCGQRHIALKTRTPRVWGLRGALIPLPTLRDWQLFITFQKRFHAKSMRMFTKQ